MFCAYCKCCECKQKLSEAVNDRFQIPPIDRKLWDVVAVDARLQAIWFLIVRYMGRSAQGEFVKVRLAQQHRARILQPSDHLRIFGGNPVLEQFARGCGAMPAVSMLSFKAIDAPSGLQPAYVHRAEQASAGSFVVIAQDYALAGEKDLAFQWLEKSMNAREGQELTLLAVDPMWNNLHGETRYLRLLRRIGLPDGIPGQHSN